MSPPWTVATPSSTIHLSPFSQADRSFPSNSTIASEGGSAFVFPGVTTGGSCHLMPERYSPFWARLHGTTVSTAPVVISVNAINFLIIVEVPRCEYENCDP